MFLAFPVPCHELLDALDAELGVVERRLTSGTADADVPQNKADLVGPDEREQPECPKISLAEMAKANEPPARGRKSRRGLVASGEPIAGGRGIPQRYSDSAAPGDGA